VERRRRGRQLNLQWRYSSRCLWWSHWSKYQLRGDDPVALAMFQDLTEKLWTEGH
jgi:hypothetical protein